MRARIATPAPASALADGIVELPPGKIAAVATYLEMTGRPVSGRSTPGNGRLPPAAELISIAGDLKRYRTLYARIGEPWLWFSRAMLADERLQAIICDPAVLPLALVSEGRDLGIVELDFRKMPDCELSFFGLVPAAVGRGLGPALLDEAIRLAFARPISRLWLHTCTLDHPAALPLYMRAGFKPYRRAIEVADDPRLGGHLPADAAPLFPIL